jgi:hypothetical protein
MQNQNDEIKKAWNEDENALDEAELDQVSGGGNGHGHGNGHGNNGNGNNGNHNGNNPGGPVLGDGSVRLISPSITDGTSNTISFGEKK